MAAGFLYGYLVRHLHPVLFAKVVHSEKQVAEGLPLVFRSFQGAKQQCLMQELAA